MAATPSLRPSRKARNVASRPLGALPVLLEPAAGVPVNGQVEHEDTGGGRPVDLERLLELDVGHKEGLLIGMIHDRKLESRLPPLLPVPRFGGLLGGAPPGLVVAVPPNRLLEA